MSNFKNFFAAAALLLLATPAFADLASDKAAVEAAKAKGMVTISMTGGTGGVLKDFCDLNLNVELGKNSSRIQETHIFIVHSLVDVMDRYFLA